jgi:hypothetical protein
MATDISGELFFNPENGINLFLEILDSCVPKYTASHVM